MIKTRAPNEEKLGVDERKNSSLLHAWHLTILFKGVGPIAARIADSNVSTVAPAHAFNMP
jgi:hypothetical protein